MKTRHGAFLAFLSSCKQAFLILPHHYRRQISPSKLCSGRPLLAIRFKSDYSMGFPGGSVVNNLPAKVGDTGSMPGSRKLSGEENGHPLQYSSPENPADKGAWWATAHGLAKSQTQLSDWAQHMGISWLRLRVSTAGTSGSIPSVGAKTSYAPGTSGSIPSVGAKTSYAPWCGQKSKIL